MNRSKQGSHCRYAYGLIILAVLGLVGESVHAQHTTDDPVTVRLTSVASGLTDAVGGTEQIFPTELVPFPDGSGRLLVATLGGVLRLIDGGGTLVPVPFHDTTSAATINANNGNASFGLTSVAFHPDFAVAGAAGFGRFYTVEPEITRTNPPPDFPGIGADQGGSNPAHDRVLYEYRMDDRSDDVFAGTKREVVRIHEHRRGHDLGDLAFDTDDYLLISSGDTVVPDSAQDLSNVFGSILRIDPLAPAATPGSTDPVSDNGQYRVPTSNPFLDDPAAIDEIFAYGLRNPYRISVDPIGGQLYVTSNGDSSRESAYAVDAGDNLGWPYFEGTLPRQTPPQGFVYRPPIFEYDHGLGSSINGAFVYRGSDLPSLAGRLVFADFLGAGTGGRLFYGDLATGVFYDVVADGVGEPMPSTIVSVGQDAAWELYLVSTDGTVARMGTTDTPPDDQPPTAPTGLVATAGVTTVGLSWQPSNDNVGVAGYRVRRDDVEIATVAGTSHLDTGLDPGATYNYNVAAFDAAGNVSPNSATIMATTAMVSGAVFLRETFDVYGPDAEPPGWRDTGAGNSMVEDPSLFGTAQVGGVVAFGTTASDTNIHSHYDTPEAHGWTGYRVRGRFFLDDAAGGVGVTVLSQYREGGVDAYYRLRRYPGEPSFHLAPHGTTVQGTIDTGVTPVANTWYRFVMEAVDTGTRTELRASVWAEGSPEPAAFQVDAFDASATRLVVGTIGFWTLGPGGKYLDDVQVESLATRFADGFESGDTSAWTEVVP